MTRVPVAALTWVERVLWILAVAIGSWTVFVVAQHSYYARLPVPDARPAEAGRRPVGR